MNPYRPVIVAACVAIACASSYVPRTNTRAAVRAYVERAAREVGAHGIRACENFMTPRWRAGEYYIFITGVDTGVTLCHPARPELVGRNEYDLQDANGEYFMREMLGIAKQGPGGGWVDYLWARPGESTPAAKSAFVIGVTGPDGVR